MANLPPKPAHLDVVLEGEDLSVIRVHGALDASVAEYMQAVHDEVATKVGYVLELHDARQETIFTADARRSYFQWNRRRKYPGAVAVLGASFTIKTLGMLLIRSVNLVTTVSGDIDFFDSEAKAREWLTQRRTFIKKLLSSHVASS